MIIDLERFVAQERPYWTELEQTLAQLESGVKAKLDIAAAQRLHYLYERTTAGLARVNTFASEPDLRRYLESLVGRAYCEVHDARDRSHRFAPWTWFIRTLPQTFRRQVAAFWLAVAVSVAGAVFGGFAAAFDAEAKSALLPEQFSRHLGDPAERVAHEERHPNRASAGQLSTFSAMLMVNNITVSIKALALGITWGLGTLVLLLYNGVLVGLIAVDYVQAGQTTFLLGWLLPHGVIELPAVMIAGQAGLVLAGALLGRGQREGLRTRLRAIAPDLATLILGVAIMLVWAGLVEAFFSQYHQPVMPYAVKIGFGLVELVVLVLFLGRCGRGPVSVPAGAGSEEAG